MTEHETLSRDVLESTLDFMEEMGMSAVAVHAAATDESSNNTMRAFMALLVGNIERTERVRACANPDPMSVCRTHRGL